MFCNNCGENVADDSVFCEKCGSKVDEIKQSTPKSKIEDTSQEEFTIGSNIKKILSGKRIGIGLNIPDKTKLERKVWYRLFKVVFYITLVLLVAIAIGVMFIYYDDKTSCSYSAYYGDYIGDCVDETKAFFGAIAVGAFWFYIGYLIVNIIRFTFYYIIYGKKK